MSRIVKVKNTKAVSDVWVGQTINPSEYFTIADSQLTSWRENTKVYTDVASGDLVVNDGSIDFTNKVDGWNWLLGNHYDIDFATPKDSDNRPYFRQSITKTTWHYSPRSLDFWSAKYGSLYNRKDNNILIDDGTDYGDGWLKFYDSTGAELVKGGSESDVDFQTRLTTNCYKTICFFEPTKNYDVFGAKFMVKNPPTERAYLWVVAAPDIPEIYGGNAAFMGGGMNLSFFPNCEMVYFDAKTCSSMTYSNTTHSGKIAIIVKHAVGVQIGIQFILDYYTGP